MPKVMSRRASFEMESLVDAPDNLSRHGRIIWCRGAVAVLALSLLGIITFLTLQNRKSNSTASTPAAAPPEEIIPEPNQSEEETLRIQIVSDLHIEFFGIFENVPSDIIIPKAPVLALLGDIGLAFTPLLREFLHEQADRFETVLFLAGNHEYYNVRGATKSVDEQTQWLQEVCNERDNLHFMEQTSMVLHGVRILATTLWSHIPPDIQEQAGASMNDYHLSYVREDDNNDGTLVRKLSPADTSGWYAQNVKWLEDQITDASTRKQQPVLVLTHHTPSFRGTSDPRFDGDKLSYCFSSDLSHLRQALPVRAWACGHTHWNFDRADKKDHYSGTTTRLVSNQRGYPGERESAQYDNQGVVLEISSRWVGR